MGLEPTRSCDHRHLKPARLPIPPLLHFVVYLADAYYNIKFLHRCQHFFLQFFLFVHKFILNLFRREIVEN